MVVEELSRLLVAIASSAAAFGLAGALATPSARQERLGRLAPAWSTGRPAGPGGPAPEGWPGFLGRVAPVLERALPGSLGERLWPAGEEARSALGERGVRPVEVHLAGLLAGLAGVFLLSATGLAPAGGGPGPALGILAGAGWLSPRLWLGAAVSRYRAAVSREMPRAAELLTLGTESGLGLLESLRLAVPLLPGPVGGALRVALAEIDAGREVKTALRSAAARVGGPEIRAFVASVVQGLELGVPIARVLRIQADAHRSRRRQVLQARIAALSLRLTLVTVLLFLPALFVLSVLPNLLAFLGGRW